MILTQTPCPSSIDWSKATDQQLWTIIKTDSECPLPLLEGVFQEILYRGQIKNFILRVLKKEFGGPKAAQEKLNTTFEDLIQLGYEGATKAIRGYQPGRGVFVSLLFTTIYQTYVAEIRKLEAEKRQISEWSYHNVMTSEDDEETMEFYLADRRTNVEKIVLDKLHFEEKIDLLNPIQKETLMLVFKGFTYNEIAEMMKTKKATVAKRLKTAFINMTGHDINLLKLGIFERVSFKKQGA